MLHEFPTSLWPQGKVSSVRQTHFGLGHQLVCARWQAGGMVGGWASDAFGHVHAVPAAAALRAVVLRTAEVRALLGHLSQRVAFRAPGQHNTSNPWSLLLGCCVSTARPVEG